MGEKRDVDMLLCLVLVLFVFYLLFQSSQCSTLNQLSLERFPPASLSPFNGTEYANLPYDETASLQYLAGLAGLGLQSTLRFANNRVFRGPKGSKRVRLIQTYGNYDVYGSGVEAEIGDDDRFTGQMYGEVVNNIGKYIRNPESCQRNVQRLQNIAIRLERLALNDPHIRDKDARRIIFAGETSNNRPRIAYKVDFRYFNGNDVRRPAYFFDACSGRKLINYDQIRTRLPKSWSTKRQQAVSSSKEVRKTMEDIHRARWNGTFSGSQGEACDVSANGVGGNEKIGQITYNEKPFCLEVARVLLLCRMDGSHQKVVDNEESESETIQTAAQFTCATGYSDAVNGAFGVANDAMYYGELNGKMWEEKFDYVPFDYQLRQVVHYGVRFENAFWDGTDAYYGDCDTILHPFVDIDTVGHEIAHGVITSNSDLIYSGMSGGINEAFADIIGETLKHYARNSNDWLISHDVVKASNSFEALRYFEDPPRDGFSIKHVLAYRPFTDVHASSGIFNYAFYRLVAIEGMDIFDATKCFHDANLNLWRPFTNFFTGACNVMQAAYDNGFNHRLVRRAFWRVGIPLIFCNYRALTVSVFSSETRDNILVSSRRSPVFKVRPLSRRMHLEAISADGSPVHIIVSIDDDVEWSLAKGVNSLIMKNTPSSVYVKVESASPDDVKVTLKVDA